MHPYKFRLSFRVFHPAMSSSKIAGLIGRKAEILNDVGSSRRTPKGRPLTGTYARTYCCFALAEGGSESLSKAFAKWNRYFLSKRKELGDITNTGGKIEYFLGVFANGNAGLELSPIFTEQVSHLGINIALDYYPFAGIQSEMNSKDE